MNDTTKHFWFMAFMWFMVLFGMWIIIGYGGAFVLNAVKFIIEGLPR